MSLAQPTLIDRLIRDFSPGFLDSPESDTLPLGASPDARNAEFVNVQTLAGNVRAVMAKRAGLRVLNPNLGTGNPFGVPVDGLFEFRKDAGTRQLLMVLNGGLWLYDGFDSMDNIPQSGFNPYWTPGRRTRATAWRRNLFIVDGTKQARWDGAVLFPMGLLAPVAAPALAVGPLTNAVNGTYEGFAIWYNQNTNHESSPGPVSAAVVFVNQFRVWTRPVGDPPPGTTHWRIYARRTDTLEVQYSRVGTTLTATTTLVENLTDGVRQVQPLGPRPHENDPPPSDLAAFVEWKGWGIGILASDDEFVVSKQGDLESWPPTQRFVVGGYGGEALTSVKNYGTLCVLQKPHASWHLIGDRLPFVVEPLHSSFGNVSQESALEIEKRFYAWDQHKGPYMTDTVSWDPLADHRLEKTLTTVNRSGQAFITAGHDELGTRIVWATPTVDAGRPDQLLRYHYGLGSWEPPQDGPEFGPMAPFTSSDGRLALYVSSMKGQVYQFRNGTRDGAPTGAIVRGTVTSAFATNVTDSGVTWQGTAPSDGPFQGLIVAVRSQATGVWQRRRISSVSGSSIHILPAVPFSPIPSVGDTIIIGGIDWSWTTPWWDIERPQHEQKWGYVYLQGRASSAMHLVDVLIRFDDYDGTVSDVSTTAQGGLTGAIWGVSLWGVGVWGSSTRKLSSKRVDRASFTAQLRMSNPYPDEPIQITAYGFTADPLPRRGRA